MEYAELPAPPHLRHVIRSFWFLKGRGTGGQVQPVVPDGRVEIVLHLAEPFALVDGIRAVRQSEALLSGQLSAPIRLAASDTADVVGIRFRTAAAGAALRLPLDDFTDQVVELDQAAPRLATLLLEAASRDVPIVARAERLAAVLAARLDPAPADRVAAEAVARLDRAMTASPIAALARDAGITVRTLERRVQAAVGLSPKLLHRVLRFRRAFHALEQSRPGRWSRAALEAGYYDQAHLIRDFRRFAGAPPSAFFSSSPDLAVAMMSQSSNREPSAER